MTARGVMPGALVLAAVLLVAVGRGPTAWERLSSIPDPEGLAGSYGGVSGEALVFAGGAHFPGKRPWEGGRKVWRDAVYVLPRPHGSWQVAGRLPRPLAYGVAVSHRGGVVCVGGCDATQHSADAFRLEWTGDRVVTTTLPALPRPVAYAAGALVGNALYVVGGQEGPDAPTALASLYRLDLASPSPRWESCPPLPGPARLLAVAASFKGALWVIGGAELVPGPGGTSVRRYLQDVYRFEPAAGWARAADLPRPVAAAPAPAPTGPSGLYLLGGDDGRQQDTPPTTHRGFSREVLRLDGRTRRWSVAGELPAAPVTTPCVFWQGRWVIPSGEVRPGVRSPEVWSFTLPRS